jgi:hypothetical protein
MMRADGRALDGTFEATSLAPATVVARAAPRLVRGAAVGCPELSSGTDTASSLSKAGASAEIPVS